MNATRVVESEPTEFSNMLTAAFTDRASRVLTRAQYQKQQQQQRYRDLQKEGLTAGQYWAKYVVDKQSAVKYYELYHPDYPEVLVNSLVETMETALQKANTGENLNSCEKKLFERKCSMCEPWDPLQEIEQIKNDIFEKQAEDISMKTE